MKDEKKIKNTLYSGLCHKMYYVIPMPEANLQINVSESDISDAGKYRVEFVDRKPVLIQVGEV